MDKKQAQKEIDVIKERLQELERIANEPEKPKRWRARLNCGYFLVCVHGDIDHDKENETRIDNARFQTGNYFQTEEEAEGSLLYHVLNDDYFYWVPGIEMDRPRGIPEGCEFWDRDSSCWIPEPAIDIRDPHKWKTQRRWPKGGLK